MKVIKSILISLAIGFCFNFTLAAGNDLPVIKVIDKKLYLSLESASTETSVKILDRTGVAVVEEKIASSGQFESVFNFEKLPLGSYTLIVNSDSRKIVKQIRMTSRELILEEEPSTAYSPAILSQKGGKVKLAVMSPRGGVVRLSVIDQKGRMCYQHMIEGRDIPEHDLNLKQLPAGTYTLIVDTPEGVYNKTIHLR